MSASPPPPRRRFGTGGGRRNRGNSSVLRRVGGEGTQPLAPEASAEFGGPPPSGEEMTAAASFGGGGPAGGSASGGLNDLEALLSRADLDDDNGGGMRTPTPPPSLPAATSSFRRGLGGDANAEGEGGPASPIVPQRRGPSSGGAADTPPSQHVFTLSSGATPRGQAASAARSLRSTPRRAVSGADLLSTPPQQALDEPAIPEGDDTDDTEQPASLSGATSRDVSAANTPAAGSPLSARKRTASGSSSLAVATRPTIPASTGADALDVPHDMRCPVCLDAFSNPVTLGCYHNVCQVHVRDLAATRGRKAGDDPSAIVLECPKCRQPTSFADAGSIRVNTEMKAIVDMMLMMLRANQASQRQQLLQSTPEEGATPIKSAPSSNVNTPRPKSSGRGGDATTPTSRGSGAGGRPPRVRFAEETSGADDTAAPPPSSRLSRAPGRTVADDSDASDGAATAAPRTPEQQPPPGHRQAKKLADLEKQLEAKRQQMIAERDRKNREATELFKKQRMEEIRSRQAVVASVDASNDPLLRKPLALRMAAGEHVAEGERPLTDTERQFRAQEAAFVAAKRERDRVKEQEREAREREVRDALQNWLKEGEDGVRGTLTTEQETQEFAARMQLAAGARPLTESVRRDVMREVAEQRLPPMPEPRPVVPPSPPPPEPFRDIEVELRLLESEREVQREVDDELSREQMAAIAERRARQSIASFRRQEQRDRPWSRGAVGTYEPTPLPASSDAAVGGVGYKPKLSRLRRIM